MTKKETLINEIKSIYLAHNELANENGFSPVIIDSRNINRKTISELNNTLEWINTKLMDLKLKVKVKNYYLTDEGAAQKAKFDKQLEELCTDRKKEYQMYQDKISKIILSRLNENWICNITNSGGSFGLKDKSNNERYIFGHSCNLYFDSWYEEKRTLKVSYGSLAPFNPLDENNCRAEFLSGMAKIASDKELFNELLEIYIEWDKNYRDSDKKINDIQKQIKNPFN